MSRIFCLLVFSVCALSHIQTPDSAPSELRHIVIDVTETTGSSTLNKRITVFRAGTTFGRVEVESQTPPLHVTTVIRGQDVWIFDMLTKKGLHYRDAASSARCNLPILMQSRYGEGLDSLEYGLEVQFFKVHKAKSLRLETAELAGESSTLSVGDLTLVLKAVTDSQNVLSLEVKKGAIRDELKYVTDETLTFADDRFVAMGSSSDYSDVDR